MEILHYFEAYNKTCATVAHFCDIYATLMRHSQSKVTHQDEKFYGTN